MTSLGDDPDEGRVARPPALLVAARAVDAPDRLGSEPDARREAEAAAVDPAERDRAGPARHESIDDLPRGGDRVSRQSERAGEDTRAAARDEPERQLAGGAVDRLVVGAVAREDDERVGLADRVRRQLGGVARASVCRIARRPGAQRARHVGDPRPRTPVNTG